MQQILQTIIRVLDGTPAEYGQRDRGQSVVELALMMPILLVLIAGIVEMGWFTNNYLILLEATRVGAREGTKLTGDGSPLTWERGAVTLQDEERDSDGNVTRNRVDLDSRDGVFPINYAVSAGDSRLGRGMSNDTSIPGDACSQGGFIAGFYTVVACQTLLAMAPADQDVSALPAAAPAPGEDIPNRNDIVVSVFSLNRVAAVGSPDCIGGCNNLARPYEENDDGDFRSNAPLVGDGSSGTRAADGAQIMVTGRFPANANECGDDSRDPFDINSNNGMDSWEIDSNRLSVLNTGGILYDDGADVQGGNAFRGFALTGKWETPGCVGSEWNINRIERVVNLQGGNVTEDQINRLPDRQGLVLVEVFWRHELLLDLPFYGNIFRILGTSAADDEDQGYIKVWAAFPIPTVGFDLEFDRACDELFFDPAGMNSTAISGINCAIP